MLTGQPSNFKIELRRNAFEAWYYLAKIFKYRVHLENVCNLEIIGQKSMLSSIYQRINIQKCPMCGIKVSTGVEKLYFLVLEPRYTYVLTVEHSMHSCFACMPRPKCCLGNQVVLFYEIRVKRGDNDLSCEKTTSMKNSLSQTEKGNSDKVIIQ